MHVGLTAVGTVHRSWREPRFRCADAQAIMLPMKPRAFIGSSVEGLDIAYALQENLDYDLEATVWPQGVFAPSDVVLTALVESLDNYDFGIFVFTPDDVVRYRLQEHATVRDNVLFELGLFIGRLGTERCFIVLPRGEGQPRLPTDLLGVTPASYQADRQDENLLAATGPAANGIRRQALRKGVRSRPSLEEQALERARRKVPLRVDELSKDLKSGRTIIDGLFSKADDYRLDGLRALMVAASHAHAISKWGVALPLEEGDYDRLLVLKLDGGVETHAFYYPDFVLDEARHFHFKVAARSQPEDAGFTVWGLMPTDEEERVFADIFDSVRSTLLEEGLHPEDELDSDRLAKHLRGLLLDSLDLRRPGPHRTDLGAIVCLVGNELAVTTNGIEHRFDKNIAGLEIWDAEVMAGVAPLRYDDSVTFYRVLDDGSQVPLTEEEQFARRRDASGLLDHPDLDKAIDAVASLYRGKVRIGRV